MEFLWWQMCLLELAKGISWAFPIFSFFLGIAWLVSWFLKDAEKVKKVMPQKD